MVADSVETGARFALDVWVGEQFLLALRQAERDTEAFSVPFMGACCAASDMPWDEEGEVIMYPDTITLAEMAANGPIAIVPYPRAVENIAWPPPPIELALVVILSMGVGGEFTEDQP